MKKTYPRIIAALLFTSASFSHAGWLSSLTGNSTAAQTRHPIVLVPGIFAFDTIASIDYWYKIPAAIESEGGKVFVAKINAFESSAKRGEELIAQLDSIRAASGGTISKFNIMGHSQGGLTARYVMNVRPDLVASLTTMHSPHTGSPVADFVTGIAPENTLRGVTLEALGNAMGDLVNLMSDNKRSKSDINAMLREFSKDGAAAYNQQFPAGLPSSYCGSGPASISINGHAIRLYSWSGTSPVSTGIDLSDLMFGTTSLAVSEANDGLTPRCASHFGTVIKDDYKMNHIDVNNHVLGIVSLFETNPKTLFQNHASRLKSAGL